MLVGASPKVTVAGEASVVSLATELASNTTVTDLDLSGQTIGDEGAIALAAALRANTTLEAIDLSMASIGSKGASALLDALEVNQTLVCLDMSGNENVESGTLSKVANLLEANQLTGLSPLVPVPAPQFEAPVLERPLLDESQPRVLPKDADDVALKVLTPAAIKALSEELVAACGGLKPSTQFPTLRQ